MIPVALARGDGAETRVPIAIIGGLLTSTVLTLGIVPVVYSLIDGLRNRFRRSARPDEPAAPPEPHEPQVRVAVK